MQHLASGGMGRVYLARASGPAGFERHVVLKTVELTGADDDARVAMFFDEARVIGRMHHQHIAPAFAAGRSEGYLYLVMDYIHGRNAAEVWDRTLDLDAALPLDFAVTVVAAAASALAYAHSRTARDGSSLSIIHRDVSLSNLMIGYDGAIKLIDFGIAKAADSSTLTQVGFVKGKVGSMAPEQVSGGRIDQRTDIFALGILLYELATMTRAFREPNDLATLERIKNVDYVPPSQVVAGFPRGLELIIAKALQRDPADRFQDAEAMRSELATFGHRAKLVLGDPAVVEVMSQLFEDRVEPWLHHDGIPGEIDDSATVPVDTTVDRVPVREATPRPAARHLRAASEIIELTASMITRRDETPTTVHATAPELAGAPSANAMRVAAMARVPLASPPRAPSGRYYLVIGAIAVIAAIGATTAVLIAGRGSSSHPRAIDAAVARPDAAVVRPDAAQPDSAGDAPEPVDAAPTSIHLRITTIPADATLLLDGERLGHTPFEADVPARPGSHVIKIRHPGYRPYKLVVALDGDVTKHISLEPADAEP